MIFTSWHLFISSKRSDHDYFSVVNEIWNTKLKVHPAQMLEVAGDLRWAPAKFENHAQLVFTMILL